MKRLTVSIVFSLTLLLLLSSLSLVIQVFGDNPDGSPITTTDYDGSWHNSNFNINLIPVDNDGVAETYYQINGGPTLRVSVNGEPLITSENSNNVLVYWSVDTIGNVELPNTLANIQLDKTAPTGSIIINNGVKVATSTFVTLYLTFSDSCSGVSQISFSNDGSPLENWESSTATKSWTLSSGDGPKTVNYQIVDNAGIYSTIYTASITLQGSTQGEGNEASPTPSSTTGTTPTASSKPTASPTDYDDYTPEPIITEDNGVSSSTILIIAAVMIAVLVPAVLVYMNGNKRNRGYGRYPMEPYYGPDMSPAGYEMEPMYEDEGMYEEELDDQYEEFHPQYGLATQNYREPAIATKYGRYATSLGPCPNCGQPVRGDQSFCLYCRQRIA